MSENGSAAGQNRQGTLSRRDACKLGLTGAVVASSANVFGKLSGSSYRMPKSMDKKPHVAVIGAGAFGGWTALYLLRGGARVTLLDAWGPGNSRASSGGETRVMRGAYGPNQ